MRHALHIDHLHRPWQRREALRNEASAAADVIVSFDNVIIGLDDVACGDVEADTPLRVAHQRRVHWAEVAGADDGFGGRGGAVRDLSESQKDAFHTGHK